jgi:hypothetical protein
MYVPPYLSLPGTQLFFIIISLIKKAEAESIPNHEKFQHPRKGDPPKRTGART